MMAAAAHVALPPPTAPDAPGPFAFADRDGVRRILESAGFTRVEIEERRGMLRIGGGTVEEAAEFLIQLGPTASALRDADPALLSRVRDAVRTALEPFATADGVRMSSAAWIVTARNG